MKLNDNRLNLPVIGMEVELNLDDEHTLKVWSTSKFNTNLNEIQI